MRVLERILPGYRQNRRVRRQKVRQRRLLLLFLVLLGIGAMLIWFFQGCGSSVGNSSQEEPAVAETGPEPPSDSFVAVTGGSPTTERPAFETLGFPAQPANPAKVVKLPVLMFHHVGETPPGADAIRTGLTVSAADFEAMMSYLKQAGYQPVRAAQLFRALFEDVPLPEKPVMLTFDDGYLDNYQIAAPVLGKYGFPAIINVVTDRMGTTEYMSWDQVAELDRKGNDIGSHTASHPDLTTLSAAALKHELFDSAAVISSYLGHPVYWLCYPAGAYDADVIRYAREGGYLLAFTTEPGEQQSSDAPFAIKRYRVRNDTGLEGFKELVR